jgi:D-lyxose ketol-isomerase
MITESEKQDYRRQYIELVSKSGIVIKDDEIQALEITDLGVNDFMQQGLGMHVYVNTDRYCAKELLLLPGQTCVEHLHPEVDGRPGKMETFRCRYGRVLLYIDGQETPARQAVLPKGSEQYYTVFQEIILNAGDQYTISHNTKHWFQAGSDGAVLSEFSSTSADDKDVFSDPRVCGRCPNTVETFGQE